MTAAKLGVRGGDRWSFRPDRKAAGHSVFLHMTYDRMRVPESIRKARLDLEERTRNCGGKAQTIRANDVLTAEAPKAYIPAAEEKIRTFREKIGEGGYEK